MRCRRWLCAAAWAASACGRIGFDAPPCAGPACTGTPIALSSIGVGAGHACGLDQHGTAYCWGDNRRGQLGQPIATTERTATPTPIAGTWSALGVGHNHTCAIAAGEVWCWGANDNGEAGVSTTTVLQVDVPTKVAFGAGAPSFEQVEVGGFHSCAIGAGQLWCWGHHDGNGTGINTTAPVHVTPLDDWYAVSLGDDHACGLSRSAGVLCWGDNDSAQIGIPAPSVVATPSSVNLPAGMPLAVAAGQGTSCALVSTTADTTRGQLWCWGRGSSYLFGSVAGDVAPIQLGADAAWSTIALGGSRGCGILGGHIRCWGYSNRGGLGGGRWAETVAVVSATDLGPADAVVVGDENIADTVADIGCLRKGAMVACWGANNYGELGIGAPSQHPMPVVARAPDSGVWTHVWGGGDHVCATASDGALWCWGADGLGETTAGDGRGIDARCVDGLPCDQPVPIRAPMTGVVGDVVLGNSYTCARTGATVGCWGDSYSGQLGGASGGNGIVPVVPPSGTWTHVTGGHRATCGTTSDGTIACWGEVAGVEVDTPLAISGAELHDLGELTFGDGGACAARPIDNARVCWGANNYAQLGDGTTMDVAQPTAYDVGTTAAVSIDLLHGCKLSTAGGVTCWGSTTAYEAGTTSGLIATPVTVSDASGVLSGCTAISTSTDHTCALCSARPVCWGQNRAGESGRGRTSAADAIAAPVAVPAGLTFIEIAAHDAGGCALETGGTLYCWGDGAHGEAGDGSHGSPYPTPVLAL
jgi:alpha-tubulin suppressor-like RCC1 family protein